MSLLVDIFLAITKWPYPKRNGALLGATFFRGLTKSDDEDTENTATFFGTESEQC